MILRNRVNTLTSVQISSVEPLASGSNQNQLCQASSVLKDTPRQESRALAPMMSNHGDRSGIPGRGSFLAASTMRLRRLQQLCAEDGCKFHFFHELQYVLYAGDTTGVTEHDVHFG